MLGRGSVEVVRIVDRGLGCYALVVSDDARVLMGMTTDLFGCEQRIVQASRWWSVVGVLVVWWVFT